MSQSIEAAVIERAAQVCELCGASEALEVITPEPVRPAEEAYALLACGACRAQIDGGGLDANHWYGLKESIWSPVPAVQGVSYRLLVRLGHEPWAVDLLDQAYLEEDVLEWAQAGMGTQEEDGAVALPRDSNGTELREGDAVTLIKALEVKGGHFTAKRGTLVKGIRLTDNPEHVEGRVNGMVIVLKTCFLKRA